MTKVIFYLWGWGGRTRQKGSNSNKKKHVTIFCLPSITFPHLLHLGNAPPQIHVVLWRLSARLDCVAHLCGHVIQTWPMGDLPWSQNNVRQPFKVSVVRVITFSLARGTKQRTQTRLVQLVVYVWRDMLDHWGKTIESTELGKNVDHQHQSQMD